MSTLTTASEVITSTNAIIPVSFDNVPIKYDGNPAHVAGVALEVMRFYERTGHFKPLHCKKASLVTMLVTSTPLVKSGTKLLYLVM